MGSAVGMPAGFVDGFHSVGSAVGVPAGFVDGFQLVGSAVGGLFHVDSI